MAGLGWNFLGLSEKDETGTFSVGLSQGGLGSADLGSVWLDSAMDSGGTSSSELVSADWEIMGCARLESARLGWTQQELAMLAWAGLG